MRRPTPPGRWFGAADRGRTDQDGRLRLVEREREARAGRRLSPRLRDGPRRGLRRGRRDRRRSLPRSGGAADDARRRRPRHRAGDRIRGTSRVERSPDGPAAGRGCHAGATATWRSCSAWRSTTPPPGTGSTAPTPCASIGLDGVQASGYVFQVEMTYRIVRSGLSVVEIPISFTDRVPAIPR